MGVWVEANRGQEKGIGIKGRKRREKQIKQQDGEEMKKLMRGIKKGFKALMLRRFMALGKLWTGCRYSGSLPHILDYIFPDV